MAIEFFTGFEGCNNTAEIRTFLSRIDNDAPWPDYDATNGYDNGKCIRSPSYTYPFYFSCSAGKTKAIGMHMKGQSTTTSTLATYAMFNFIGPNIYLFNRSAGIEVRDSVGSLGTISGSTLLPPGQTHIQVKIFSDASVGYVEIYINGVSVGSLTGINTGGEDITEICIRPTSSANNMYIDNIYISDQIEGELTSVLCKPIADSSVQFTPSEGTANYAMIDEIGADTATYVESSILGHQDLYVFEDVISDYTVKGVSVVTQAKKLAGTRGLRLRAEQDAVEYNVGSELILSVDYPFVAGIGTSLDRMLPTAPDGTAWSIAKFNACKLGFKIST